MENKQLLLSSSYANVIFEYALKNKKEHLFFKQMEYLLNMLKTNNYLLLNFLCNNNITKDNKKTIINELFNKKLDQYLIYTLYAIIDFNRNRFIPIIIRKYFIIYDHYFNIIFIRVYSSQKLSDKNMLKLKQALSKHYHSKVTLLNVVDENLIGGIRIETKNTSIDNSYITKLKKMYDESLLAINQYQLER